MTYHASLKNASESDLVDEMRGINVGIRKLHGLGQQFLYGGLLLGLLYLRHAEGIVLEEGLDWLTWAGTWGLGILLVWGVWRGRKG